MSEAELFLLAGSVIDEIDRQFGFLEPSRDAVTQWLRDMDAVGGLEADEDAGELADVWFHSEFLD